MKRDLKKLLCFIGVFSMFVFFALGCGSKGGKATEGDDGGGDGGGETPPQPTYNLTGTVVGVNGLALPQVRIWAVRGAEDFDATVTDASGQFSMDLAEEMHTIIASRQGFVSASRVVDLTSGASVEQILILRTSDAPAKLVGAQAGGSVLSNDEDTQLDIPSQSGGVFNGINETGASDASKATFSVERLNLSEPLPVPLPSPDTLAAEDIIIDGKQAPSLMVSINPPLLEMPSPADLQLPNPDQLSNVRILRFDPYEKRWSVVGMTDNTPEDGTSLTVSDAGVYGIFYETNRTLTVKGTATPGSFVHVGDEVIKVLSDGTFYAGEVAIPANGQLEIVAIGPDGEVIEKTVQNLSPGDVITVPLSIVELSDVSVTAGDEQIAADGESTTIISATVIDVNREAALDGTEVVFSTTAGTLLCPATSTGCNETLGGVKAQTSNGIARAILKSSSVIGTATVTVAVEALTDNVTVDFVAGLPDRADVTANPLNLTANGSQTSTISAVVYDATGRRLEGRSILFSLDPSDMGQLDPSVTTTSQAGIASVVYTAPTKTGAVTISARDEESGNLLGSVDITLIEALVASIEPSTGADSIVADEKKVLVAAMVTDFDGNAVSDGTVVTFTTSAGTFDGATGDDQTLIEPTTIGGIATTRLISPTNVGTANITITAGGVWATTSVDFVPGPPASITASASPSKLTVGQGETTTITVMVRDKNNNLVPGETVLIGNNEQAQDQSQVIYGSLGSGTAVTDANGTATFQYTPPSLVPEEGKDVIIVQTTSGVSATVEVQLEGPRIAGIVLSVDPTSLPADGQTQAIVSATLTLVGGDPAPEDTPVFFEVISGGGGFTNNIAQSFTVEGEAIARLTSGTTPGTATVRVGTDKFEDAGTERVGGIVQEIEIEYTPGSIILSISPNLVLGTNPKNCDGAAVNCAEIAATLENTSGEPAVGEEVVLTLDGSAGMSRPGTIRVKDDFRCPDNPNENVGCSDNEGTVKAFFLPPNDGGEVTVTATWETDGVEVTETGTITVNPPPVVINVVQPDPTEISVRGTGGNETVQLFFEVKDSSGNPVVGGYRVDFEILTGPGGGEIVTPAFDLTEEDGRVGTVLRSGFTSGPVSVKATYFSDSNISAVTSQVVIKAGRPVGEEFGITRTYRNISGLTFSYLENPLRVNAGDYYGNAVPNGTAISFKTYNTGGLIEEGEQDNNTVDGFATSTLYSTSAPWPLEGGVSITAEAVGGMTTHVTSIDLVPFGDSGTYVVFAGTDGGGVYKSLDSGRTWANRSRSSEEPGQNWIAPYINDISIDRDAPKIVYAATGYLGEGNIYRSDDGGLTWNGGKAEEWMGLKSYPNSDLMNVKSAVSVVLCDYDDASLGRDYPFVWAGTEYDGFLYSEDGVIFRQADGLGKGNNIQDIVRVTDTHGPQAILYAATGSGIYKSYPIDEDSGGGRKWFYNTNDPSDGVPNPFFGDHVNTLVVHPGSDGGVSDILYAGTEDSGVWVTTDSGKSWKNYKEGFGEGLMSTPPAVDIRNTGTGRVTDIDVGKRTLSENWMIIKDDSEDGFTVTGSVSGSQPDALIGQAYELDEVVSFTIVEGNVPFAKGDRFTFTTVRNPGLNIRKLLLDETNKRLYAVSYFEPEGFHPVGNLYYYELASDGSGFMEEGGLWKEASAHLPQFDPPDDQTLFAQHTMAFSTDAFGKTKSLFIGGEGINLHKAVLGLDGQSIPEWADSGNGMNNTIMARTFALFTGEAEMSFELVSIKNKEGQEIPIELPVTIEDESELIFEAYVQDEFGNPPIQGSTFSVTSGNQRNVFTITYPDALIYPGTWRDPTDGRTDNPFRIQYIYDADNDGSLIFEFDPDCPTGEITVPGCSGSFQQIAIPLPIIRDTFWFF